ncbi:MAG: CotH kinase family protein, partial [Planctomycetota bacterium]|nr:CotH kinase family protein [Planctomycetota bacterium]
MLLPTRLIIYLLVITAGLLLPPSGRCQGTRLPSIGEVRKELLSKYDANEDGWLDAQEREEVRKGTELRARSSFRRRGRRGGRWRQEENRPPPKEPSISASTSREQWQAVVKAFDKNENGAIDGEEIKRLYEAIDAGLVGDLPITRLRSSLLRDSKTRRAGRTNLKNYDLDYDDRLSAGELDAFRKAKAAGEPPPERPERAEQEDVQEEAREKPPGDALPERAPRVVFNHPHGIQDESFELELTTPLKGAVIRYTLDCSDPDESSSAVFKDTLEIDRSTVVRARSFAEGYAASFTETRTYLFLGDVVSQSTDGLPPPGGYYRWGPNRVDYGMDSAVTLDPVYRKTILSDLKAIPSVSLVVDPQGLFSSETGIYSNAIRQGRENERPGSFELLPAEGIPGFDINCGVRIRGGFSRTAENPKHAFRLFFRKLYGKGKLKYPFFGPAASQEFDNVDMRCSQNYSWNMGGDSKGLFLRDQFSRDLQLALGRPAARGDYYHLYLNGQYWGLYNSCERPEASFAASYFGGVKEDYDVVKVDSGRGQSYTITATDG